MDRKLDGRTDQTKMMTLILAFQNFANTPKNITIKENIVQNRLYLGFSLIIARIF